MPKKAHNAHCGMPCDRVKPEQRYQLEERQAAPVGRGDASGGISECSGDAADSEGQNEPWAIKSAPPGAGTPNGAKERLWSGLSSILPNKTG